MFGSNRLSRCCCFSARTGALILASLGIAGGLFGTAGYSGVLATGNVFDGLIDAYEGGLMKQLHDEGRIDERQLESITACMERLRHFLPYVIAFGLAFSLFSFAVHGMLLFGVAKSRPCMMLPWMIAEMVYLVLSTLAVVGTGAFAMVKGALLGGLVMWLIASPFLVLGFYLWKVVQSVYMDIREQGRGYKEFDVPPKA